MADLTSIFGSGLGQAWFMIGQFTKWLAIGIVGMGIIYLIVYVIQYKYPVHLLVQEGSGVRLKKDRGKKDKKKQRFSLLKNRDISCSYPQTKHEVQVGKKAMLYAFVKNQCASWMEIRDNDAFIPADYDMQQKMIDDFDQQWSITKPKENWWQMYGNQIMLMGGMGIFLITIILILKRMDKIMELGKSVMTASREANKQVIENLWWLLFIRKKKDEN